MIEYAYRMLGHPDAFVPNIEQELIALGINAEYSEIPSDRRLWRIPINELDKLPQSEDGPYFGNREYGYELFFDDWEQDRIRMNGTDWKKIG